MGESGTPALCCDRSSDGSGRDTAGRLLHLPRDVQWPPVFRGERTVRRVTSPDALIGPFDVAAGGRPGCVRRVLSRPRRYRIVACRSGTLRWPSTDRWPCASVTDG